MHLFRKMTNGGGYVYLELYIFIKIFYKEFLHK